MTQHISTPTTGPTVQTRSPYRAEDTTRKGHHQEMQTHLSAKPPAKSKSSTHPCITIRWWAPPPSYLPVANRAGRPADVRSVAAGVGGGVAC
jgi:hypothetical protein